MKNQFPILIVDDDPDLLHILKMASSSGFPEAVFTQVYNTTEAITYLDGLHGSGPKLILLDIYLGDGVNGLELLTHLQTYPNIRLLPVIMLTAVDSDQNIKTAYSIGATSFTVKPNLVAGWIAYLKTLRLYWLKTVTLPPISFRRVDDLPAGSAK